MRGKRPVNERQSRLFALITSLTLILGGIAFFLDSLDVIQLRHLWRFWPLLLIALGVSKFVGAAGTARRVYGAVFIFEGVFFQLATLGVIPLRAGTIAPLLSIGCGVLLLLQHFQRREMAEIDPESARLRLTGSQKLLNHIAVFSGSKLRTDSQSFEGGDLVSVFGSIELDLRKTNIMAGGTAVIDNTTVFGSINVRIPETWAVVIDGLAVFGAYEDKTLPPRPAAGVESPRLVLTGFTVFGAVSIEN